jgi:hypothetical protein
VFTIILAAQNKLILPGTDRLEITPLGAVYLDMLQMFLISLVKDNDAQGESTAQRDVVPSCARQIQELQLLNNPKLNSV